jgi:tetratricopeptide (TPR) repeat protein
MKRSCLIALIVLSLAGAFACSKKAANTDESANANAVAESPFASITDPNAALAEGDRLLDENQTGMAIGAYRRAVELNPELAEGFFKLGIAYALLDMQKEQAGEDFGSSSNAKGKSQSEKAFEKAVDAYKKWIEANPKDDVAQFNLGRTYAKLTKDDEAEKAFRQAVKLKPEDTEYQTELGAILIKLAKYREAIEPLKKAIDLDHTNSRAQDLLEDAEAGRQRLDYVPKKDDNSNGSNKASNVNANTSANSNSATTPNTNTAPKGPDHTKPEDQKERKDKKGGAGNKLPSDHN